MYQSIPRTLNYICGVKCKQNALFTLQRLIVRDICSDGAFGTVMPVESYRNRQCSFLPLRTISRPLTCSISLSKNIAPGIHENISALQMKKRPQRKKRLVGDEGKSGFWSAIAYATAEEYDLEKVRASIVEQELYDIIPIDRNADNETNDHELDVLHAAARYAVGSEPREMFIFREGSVIFWNMDEFECSNLLTFLRSFEENGYDELLVQSESDVMPYSKTEERNSCISNGVMLLNSEDAVALDKYTFSNAMALSVKLGIWEASLDRYVDSIEYVTEDLKRGSKIRMSREDVLRKTGELFALRHLINLGSDLLDTPDFYWDREEQEALYNQTCAYFSIQKRTKVMNDRLRHCLELVELLSSHLNDKHHVRLEWMIIILIMVEVGFEIIHYVERFSH